MLKMFSFTKQFSNVIPGIILPIIIIIRRCNILAYTVYTQAFEARRIINQRATKV